MENVFGQLMIFLGTVLKYLDFFLVFAIMQQFRHLTYYYAVLLLLELLL